MEERRWIARRGFWPLALLWLPAGVAAHAAVRFLSACTTPGIPFDAEAERALEGLELVNAEPAQFGAAEAKIGESESNGRVIGVQLGHEPGARPRRVEQFQWRNGVAVGGSCPMRTRSSASPNAGRSPPEFAQ